MHSKPLQYFSYITTANTYLIRDHAIVNGTMQHELPTATGVSTVHPPNY